MPMFRWALLVVSLLCSACDGAGFSAAPVAAACASIGSQCQLPDGPLGVCQEAPCGAGAARPCFKCTSQH
ncbi:MAG: hypothetical protein ACRERC_02345 [Candidatus Binatia bacterium]